MTSTRRRLPVTPPPAVQPASEGEERPQDSRVIGCPSRMLRGQVPDFLAPEPAFGVHRARLDLLPKNGRKRPPQPLTHGDAERPLRPPVLEPGLGPRQHLP